MISSTTVRLCLVVAVLCKRRCWCCHHRRSEDEDRLEMLFKKAMSLRGATWAKALGATRQSRSYTGRTCIGYEIAALRSMT